MDDTLHTRWSVPTFTQNCSFEVTNLDTNLVYHQDTVTREDPNYVSNAGPIEPDAKYTIKVTCLMQDGMSTFPSQWNETTFPAESNATYSGSTILWSFTPLKQIFVVWCISGSYDSREIFNVSPGTNSQAFDNNCPGGNFILFSITARDSVIGLASETYIY